MKKILDVFFRKTLSNGGKILQFLAREPLGLEKSGTFSRRGRDSKKSSIYSRTTNEVVEVGYTLEIDPRRSWAVGPSSKRCRKGGREGFP